MNTQEYCRWLAKEMEDTWQRLPISNELCGSHPIPLRATLAIHEGAREPRPQDVSRYNSPQEAVDAALKGDRPVVVFGDPGAGKTVTMKWLARTFALRAVDASAEPDALIPAYVDLGAYRGASDLDMVLERRRASEPTLREATSTLWLLDGLDLLSDGGGFSVSQALESAASFVRNGRDRFVCSTREHALVTSCLDGHAKSLRVSVEPLAKDARAEWVEKNCPRVKASVVKFERAETRPFLNTPLLFAMVLSAIIDESKTKQPFRRDKYDGQAGLFHGFVAYALARAVNEGRITDDERTHLDHDVVEGVFWAALNRGYDDRIPADTLTDLCATAFGEKLADEKRRSWNTAAAILTGAGLLTKPDASDQIAVLHQRFAEYWAARHLARRLVLGYDEGWFAAEVWDHAKEPHLDPVLGQAISIASNNRQELLREAHGAVAAGDSLGALWLLTYAGGNRGVDLLLSALMSKNAGSLTRQIAAQALGRIGNEQALSALISVLEDRNSESEVRRHAIWAIGLTGGERAADALLSTLMNTETHFSLYGRLGQALGQIGGATTVDSLSATLMDEKAGDFVRRTAAEALGMIGGDRAINALTSVLGNAEAPTLLRNSAVDALAATGSERATEALCSMVTDSQGHIELRRNSAYFLARIGGDRPVGELVAVVADTTAHAEIRIMAASALGMKGNSRARDVLVSVLLDKKAEPNLRYRAAQSLCSVGDELVLEPLISVLADAEEGPALRGGAADAAGAIGGKRAIEVLTSILEDRAVDEEVAAHAAAALGRIGNHCAVESLVSALVDRSVSSWVRLCASGALGVLRDRRAVDSLTMLLADKEADSELRNNAAGALGDIGDHRAIGELVSAVSDRTESRDVRIGAAYALAKIDSSRVIDALIDALPDDAYHSDYSALLISIGKTDPQRYCRDYVRKGRAKGVPYSRFLSVCLGLGVRIEPWDMEASLAAQRRKRDQAESATTVGGMTVHVKNGDANIVTGQVGAVGRNAKVEGDVHQQHVTGVQNKATQDEQSDPWLAVVRGLGGRLLKWIASLFGGVKK